MAKKGKLFVYNIALKREDGKIERDTIYRDTLFTQDEAEEMCNHFFCSVLLSYAGVFTPASDSLITKNSIFVKMPEPDMVVDSDGCAHPIEEKERLIAEEKKLQDQHLLKSELNESDRK